VSLLDLKYQSRKNLPFPRIENLSKIFFRVIIFQKMCQNCTKITIKGPFKIMGEEKWIKYTPHETKKILGVAFKKNWKYWKLQAP
jgi:hypothetical protein